MLPAPSESLAVEPVVTQESSSGSLNLAGWNVAGASVQGVSHQRLDLPCQDAHGWLILDNGLLLIAVADGAGTAQFSELGAQMAVEEVLQALAHSFSTAEPPDEELYQERMLSAFDAARQAIGRQAQADDQPVREYAATLACAVASAEWLLAGQIGDGAIVADFGEAESAEAQELTLVVRLQRGEYANETHFITQEDALQQAVIEYIARPVRALAVMSDGLIRLALKMPAQEPHAPFFQPLFRFVSTLEEHSSGSDPLVDFLGSERVNARADDDKTLVLAVRRYQQEPFEPGPVLEQGVA